MSATYTDSPSWPGGRGAVAGTSAQYRRTRPAARRRSARRMLSSRKEGRTRPSPSAQMRVPSSSWKCAPDRLRRPVRAINASHRTASSDDARSSVEGGATAGPPSLKMRAKIDRATAPSSPITDQLGSWSPEPHVTVDAALVSARRRRSRDRVAHDPRSVDAPGGCATVMTSSSSGIAWFRPS